MLSGADGVGLGRFTDGDVAYPGLSPRGGVGTGHRLAKMGICKLLAKGGPTGPFRRGWGYRQSAYI
jgi:hypothetical protein